MRYSNDAADDIGRLDPIDGAHTAASWSGSRAKQALFEEIAAMPVETAAPRSHQLVPRVSGRRVRLAGAVGIAAIALVVAQGVISSPTPAYGIRPLPNGVIEVTVSPQLRDGDALAADLRSYGVDVEINTVPSSPSLVGEVEVFAPGGGDYIPAGLSFGEDGTSDVFNWTIDPAVFTERLTIEVNVAAQTGEQYVKSTTVFEPGEVLAGLHCALGDPLRAAAVAPYLADLGLTPIWYVVSPTGDPSIADSTVTAEVPDGEILGGFSLDATTVNFDVVLDGVTLGDGWDARPADVACTPDLAARWL